MKLKTCILVFGLLVSMKITKAQNGSSALDSIKLDARRQIASVLQSSDSVKVEKVEKIFEAYRLQMKAIIASEVDAGMKIEKSKTTSEERDRSLIELLTQAELEKLLPGRDWQKRKEEIESKETLSPEQQGG